MLLSSVLCCYLLQSYFCHENFLNSHSSHENFINSLVSLEIVANAIDNRSSFCSRFCSRNVGVNNVLTAGSNVLSLAHHLVGVLLLEIH